MKVAWFPKSEDLVGNPYWECLQAGLEALGVEFETSHSSHWMRRKWLLDNREAVAVLHFHFVQSQYVGQGERLSARRLLKFTSDLLLARLLGYRIVWTMHDLMPTWPKEPRWVEMLGRYAIAWLAHDVIVHCQEAKRLLAQHFGRRGHVHVFPHPSYAGAYPNEVSAAEARRTLQIDFDRFVLAFVGGIRPNKGLEELIAAFGQFDDPQAVLLIAGRPWPPDSYVEQIRRMAGDDTRIRLHAQEIPDEELQLYLKAADVVVLPFKRVLTSGSAILAMSYGRAVIVPRLGCLPELVGADAGFIYDASDRAGLAEAIKQAGASDLEAMGHAAARRANVFRWSDLADGLLQVYSSG